MDQKEKLEMIKKHIATFPDYPKKGIIFWDIFSVLKEPKIFQLLKEVLFEAATKVEPRPECVIGLDARGFLFGPLLALELNVPFVPIRKEGKLPGEVVTASYSKEYGEVSSFLSKINKIKQLNLFVANIPENKGDITLKDTLALQVGSIHKRQKVILIDDLLATGGTLKCASDLVKKVGGEVVGCLIVIELEEQNGRKLIEENVSSLIKI